ncbi:hypothetical protein HPB47_004345 [Ixodes persulcatus]|uniref:Uncharacterized protein n=1 Tax=Ixodes persulcatus TaxID=34615 RepID=A0AC60PH23_IXOPE|nr:hypothetical protein HPB47_004345 [Ixodes persulcatus]
MTSIVDAEVSASPHRTLNTICGVLSEDDFLDASEKEILEGLKDGGVVAVKRIMLRKDGKETPSKHAKENITYLEAKKRLSFLSKGGYAEVVRRGPAPRLETRATQVSPENLAADLRAPFPQQEQHAVPLGKGGPAIAVPTLPFKTVAQGQQASSSCKEGALAASSAQNRLDLSTLAALPRRRRSEALGLSPWRGSQQPRSCVARKQVPSREKRCNRWTG